MQGANKLKSIERKKLPASLFLELFLVLTVCGLTANDLSASLFPKITSIVKKQIVAEQFSDHLQRTTSYTEDGLPADQTIDSAAGQIHRRYEYDPAGNLLAKTDNTRITMGYDALGRHHTKAVNGRRTLLSIAETLKNSGTGPYKILSNSCTSTVSDILTAGGSKPSWWAKTPSLIYKWF